MHDVRHARIETEVGQLTVVATGEAISGIYFPEHWHPPATGSIGLLVDASSDPVLDAARRQLGEYFAGSRRTFELSVMTNGNDFQERVWSLLRTIPFGETRTYGELARELGGDASLARAVGSAVGRNPVSIVVGCHRVLGAGGKLTGFAGGLDRKRFLLELEDPTRATAQLF